MTKSTLAAGTPIPLCASSRLLGAALAGLLCLSGCSKQDADGAAGASGKSSHGGTGGNPAGGSSSQEEAGAGAESPDGLGGHGGATGSEGGATDVGGTTDGGGTTSTPEGGANGMLGDAGTTSNAGTPGAGGTAGAPAEYPHIVSSENVGALTEEQFTTLCNERGGTVEVMPHCGGFATAKGFSYDSTTQLLSEHTCAGTNTCAGWNCVVPD
jgi:hypothetical protein